MFIPSLFSVIRHWPEFVDVKVLDIPRIERYAENSTSSRAIVDDDNGSDTDPLGRRTIQFLQYMGSWKLVLFFILVLHPQRFACLHIAITSIVSRPVRFYRPVGQADNSSSPLFVYLYYILKVWPACLLVYQLGSTTHRFPDLSIFLIGFRFPNPYPYLAARSFILTIWLHQSRQ